MNMNKPWPRSACLCESARGVFEEGSCYYGLPFIMVTITRRRRVDSIDGDYNHCNSNTKMVKGDKEDADNGD